ncbi:hypothetical protein CAPTEDRAFT_169765 [Capitella teleta]|uniref:Glycoside hydrolase family 31 N-terminal domain-containing protein n=1 Tax=Capitella teleta TaxID=283909 RepID=R7U6Z4_CAPTE|nr:hypothetical protein CAPTEDRAFT_169765 [Capitella teleta]|eukprot:ELU01911.1 hypothetical protein CAPTEDRAFT_169765 [Capitella teleta]
MTTRTVNFHSLTFDVSKNICLTLHSPLRPEGALDAVIGQTFTKAGSVDVKESLNEVTFEWSGYGSLVVTHREVCKDGHRYDLTWESTKPKSLSDAFEFGVSKWFGATVIKQHTWPLNKWRRKSEAFVCGNSYEDAYGGVQERYWLSSDGVALFVDDDVPLFVSMNHNKDRKLTFTSKYDSPYKNIHKKNVVLKYSILQSKNIRSVHDLAIQEFLGKPRDIPCEDLFRYPIWSTWAQYKKNINQKIVLEFAEKVKEHGFRASQIEIDDDWTPAYGDMEFDKKKFPGAKHMIQQIHDMGFKVTAWVHPFVSPKASVARRDYWVNGSMRGVFTWWNGLGKALDVTNPGSVAWFKGCLNLLKEQTGLDSYKFDAGETKWIPSGAKFHEDMESPNTYSQKWAELCCSIDPDLRALEIRVGFRTQHLPAFIRMMDKDSKWDHDNGLKTLIPHALTFSILGYPFVLPDMIGGNAYKGMPDRELYIRWLQANALMPSMQYSVVPWQYDDEVVEIAKKMDALHEKYSDLLITLGRMAVATGEPIMRPVWWNAPYDEIALNIDDEFLVGDDILVAPVLDKGARMRNIYLPAGSWKDLNSGTVYTGGKWYNDFQAKLEELPHFLLQERKVVPKPRKKKPQKEEKKEEEEEKPAEVPEETEEKPIEEEVKDIVEEEEEEGDEGGAGGGGVGLTPMDLAEELRQKLADFWEKRMEEEIHEGDDAGSVFAAKDS